MYMQEIEYSTRRQWQLGRWLDKAKVCMCKEVLIDGGGSSALTMLDGHSWSEQDIRKTVSCKGGTTYKAGRHGGRM